MAVVKIQRYFFGLCIVLLSTFQTIITEPCGIIETPFIQRLMSTHFNEGGTATISVRLRVDPAATVRWIKVVEDRQTFGETNQYKVPEVGNSNIRANIKQTGRGRVSASLIFSEVTMADIGASHELEIFMSKCADVITTIPVKHAYVSIRNIETPTIMTVTERAKLIEDQTVSISVTTKFHHVSQYKEESMATGSKPPMLTMLPWKHTLLRDGSTAPEGVTSGVDHTEQLEWNEDGTFTMTRGLTILTMRDANLGQYCVNAVQGYFDGEGVVNLQVCTELTVHPEFQGEIRSGSLSLCSGRTDIPFPNGAVPIRRDQEDCVICASVATPHTHMLWTKQATEQIIAPTVSYQFGESYLIQKLYLRGDESHIGSYRCDIGYRFPNITKIFDVVTYHPASVERTTPNEVLYEPDKSIIFECRAEGSPIPQIEFYKGPTFEYLPPYMIKPPKTWSRVKPDDHITITTDYDEDKTTSRLVINNPGHQVAGGNLWDWKCFASNFYSWSAESMRVNVRPWEDEIIFPERK